MLGPQTQGDGETKKLNKLQKKAEKHADKLKELNIRQVSNIGEKVINLKRGCTDIYCCFILIAVVLVCIGLGIYGLHRGGTGAIAPYTLDGQQCGNSEGFENYPYLYFTDIQAEKTGDLTEESIRTIFDMAVCVKNCPMKGRQFENKATTAFKKDSGTSEYYTITAGFVCLPDPLEMEYNNNFVQQFRGLIMGSEAGSTLVFVLESTPKLFISSITAGIISMLYIYALANFAKEIAYIVIGLFELVFIIAIIACLATPIIAAIPGVLLIAFNVLLWCKWSKVKMAIAVIDATAEFFVLTKRIYFVSIMYFVLICIWVIFWGACVIAMLGGTGFEWSGSGTVTHQERSMAELGEEDQQTMQNILNFMYFAFVWVVFFLNESNIFVLMCSVSTFYFDSSSQNTGEAQVKTSLRWTHVNHTGSIAMGSGIHTIIKYILESNSEGDSSGGGGMAKCLAVCSLCAMSWLEDIIEYLNVVTYAYMAITGDTYCKSAWNGFLLHIKHLSQFFIANGLAGGFVFLGKILIVALNMGIFLLIDIRSDTSKMAESEEQVGVLYFIVFLITIIISNIFLGLFVEAVISTLHCMAMDLELNNGRPKYGTPNFHEKIKNFLGEEKWKEVEAERQVYYGSSQVHPVPGQQNLVQYPNQVQYQQPMNIVQPGMYQPQMVQQPVMMQGQTPMMMGNAGMVQSQTVVTTTQTTSQQINVNM